MIWPFSVMFGKADKRIAQAEIAAAEARTQRYLKLFEIDRLDNKLDAMVRRSLKLLEPERPHD